MVISDTNLETHGMISAIVKEVQQSFITPSKTPEHGNGQEIEGQEVMETPTKIPGNDGNDGQSKNAAVDLGSSPAEATQKTVIVTSDGSPVVQQLEESPLAQHPGVYLDSPEIVVTEHDENEQAADIIPATPWSDHDDVIHDNPVVMPTPLLHVNFLEEGDTPIRHREKQVIVSNHTLYLAADFDDVLGPSDEVLGYRSWRQTSSVEHLDIEIGERETRSLDRPRLKSSTSAPQLKVQPELFSVPSILDQMQYELPAQVSNNAAQSASCHVDVAEYKLDSVNFDKDVSSTESQNAVHIRPSQISKETLNELEVKDSETIPDVVNAASSKYIPSNFDETKSESYEDRGSKSSFDDEYEAVDLELDIEEKDIQNAQQKDEKECDKISENDRTFTESSSFEKEAVNATEGGQLPNKSNNEQDKIDNKISDSSRCTVENIADFKEPYSENQADQTNANAEQDSAVLNREHKDSGSEDLCHVPTLTEITAGDCSGFNKAEPSYRNFMENDEEDGDFYRVPTLTELAGQDDDNVVEAFTSNDVLAGRRWSEDDQYEIPDTMDSKDDTIVPKPPPGRSGRGCISAR